MSDQIARWLVLSGERGRIETPKGSRVWRVTAKGPTEGVATIDFEGTDQQWIVPAGETWVVEPEGYCEAHAIAFNETAAFAVEFRVT